VTSELEWFRALARDLGVYGIEVPGVQASTLKEASEIWEARLRGAVANAFAYTRRMRRRVIIGIADDGSQHLYRRLRKAKQRCALVLIVPYIAPVEVPFVHRDSAEYSSPFLRRSSS